MGFVQRRIAKNIVQRESHKNIFTRIHIPTRLASRVAEAVRPFV